MRTASTTRGKAAMVAQPQERRHKVIYKRGKIWWMDFVYKGRRIQKSTKLRNVNDARDAEAAERTRLVRRDFGIDTPVACPSFADFKTSFMAWVRSKTDHPRTWAFYETCY